MSARKCPVSRAATVNYQILWKFTRILFCAESVFNHKKQCKSLNKFSILAVFLISGLSTENAKI